jgi:hypothetical protein
VPAEFAAGHDDVGPGRRARFRSVALSGDVRANGSAENLNCAGWLERGHAAASSERVQRCVNGWWSAG